MYRGVPLEDLFVLITAQKRTFINILPLYSWQLQLKKQQQRWHRFTTSSKLNGLILRHLQNSAKIVIKNKWLSTLQAPLQDSHKCVYAHCLIFKVFSQFGFGETNDSK